MRVRRLESCGRPCEDGPYVKEPCGIGPCSNAFVGPLCKKTINLGRHSRS